ncbi:MAG: cytochrome c biogenesis protein CcsA, partial [Bdellovibrionales bacterium]|nr:cytochrome c biogenesis protein CcsA [Bdellovibrionales bacterium]
DTFARESLQLIYGKSTYKGKAASEIVFTWSLLPQHWQDVELFEISRKDLKENLKFDLGRKYFSIKEIIDNPRLSLLMQELESKRADREKLDPYFQGVERLESQLQTFQAVVGGFAFSFVPENEGHNWKSVREFDEGWKERYQSIVSAFAASLQDPAKEHELDLAVDSFITAARAENPESYPSDLKIAAETHYNSVHPFRWAWITYLAAAIFLSCTLLFGWTGLWALGWVSVLIAFTLHTYGFGLRVFITGRPPVSNMYESIIWVAWGVVVFAMIFEYLKRKKYFIVSASIAATLAMVAADVAPNIFDPTLQPLQPVLRSNLWLIVHVMTITLGYSAFFLGFVLADIGLWHFIKDENAKKNQILNLSEATYRAVQVGVVLLAAGTILGGVWADYSWGRFWGWDPKETWAFIALMGYIAVLHCRIAGWVRHFGFMVLSAACFSLVIMAWYGVNFVLGAGLHSYGFGGGGIEYVTGFVAIEIVYLAYVTTVRRSRKKSRGV